jgi:uncharacterized protein YqiB (DUF1249 family)
MDGMDAQTAPVCEHQQVTRIQGITELDKAQGALKSVEMVLNIL